MTFQRGLGVVAIDHRRLEGGWLGTPIVISARASLNVGAWSTCDAQPPDCSFMFGRCLVQRPIRDLYEQVWRRYENAKDLCGRVQRSPR